MTPACDPNRVTPAGDTYSQTLAQDCAHLMMDKDCRYLHARNVAYVELRCRAFFFNCERCYSRKSRGSTRWIDPKSTSLMNRYWSCRTPDFSHMCWFVYICVITQPEDWWDCQYCLTDRTCSSRVVNCRRER